METHVVDGKIPLLLSQHAQAALHFTKSMGDAKCYVGNAELELCRARNSGLLCVNLSEGLKSLKSKRLPKQLRELKNTDYGMSFNNRPSDQLTAFMADEERPTRGTFTLGDPACVHILMCGKEFHGQIASFDRSKSLTMLGPILAQFDPGRRLLVFDCMGFGDPQHDPQLRAHVGTHPEIIRGMTGSEKTMEALLYGLHHLKVCHEKGQQLAVIAYCRRNRHRSVSFGWLLATAFSKLWPRAHLTLTHSNQEHSWSQMSGTCKGKCAMCTHESHDALEAALRSRDYVLKQFGLKAAPTYSHVGQVVFDSEAEARESERRTQAPVDARALPPPPCPKKPPLIRPAVVKASSAKASAPVPKGTHTMSHRGPGSVRPAPPDPPLAAATPKAPAPEAPAREEDESRYNEDAELRRRDKAETSRQAEPRGESVATSQPDAATQALLQTVELLTQQVKHTQEREHERRRSRSRDRRRRERSDSREYYRGRRRDDSREYRRGRSRSLSRRRSPSFGRIPTPPKLIPREPEGPPPRWHYYRSGRGTSRDSEQSAWQERRYVSSSERPGASHFPRATGAWPSHLEFPTVEGDGPWNGRVNLEHMPLELLDRIWDSVPDLGMKASRCALRWGGPFFPGSTSLTSKEIAKSNHELNVKIVVQHETYDHGKRSAKPSRAYYTDYMKDDGWQASSFEHVEGQWEMTLLRGNLENQPLELDWYVKGRILIFSPPFARPEEHEDVEEEEEEPAGGDDQEDGNDGQEPPGEDGDDGDGPSGGPSKRNKVVELALQGSDLQITFKSDWIDWSDLAVVTFSDASFANEEGFKSQQGRIHYITNASSLKEGSRKMHLISFGSTTLKRVCRATLQAEAYALQTAVEHGDRLRCLICELTGRLDDFKNWHEETQRRMAHVYYTDCRSLSDHLLAEVPRKVQDKRLGIELAALRQGVWTVNGEKTSEIYSPYGDHLRWIETSKQLADPLTKSMRPDYLLKTLESGLVNVENSGACEKGAKKKDEEVSPDLF